MVSHNRRSMICKDKLFWLLVAQRTACLMPHTAHRTRTPHAAHRTPHAARRTRIRTPLTDFFPDSATLFNTVCL